MSTSDLPGLNAQGESRWPIIATILAILALLELMPNRVRVMPGWFPYVAAIVLVAPLLGNALIPSPLLARIERFVIYAFVGMSVLLIIFSLVRLVEEIISPTGVGGVALLASSIAVWFVNVLAFSLLYWRIDRGGPDRRATPNETAPEILFPETPPESNQRISFIDYLFFAFTTSTAFSPTEAYPITPRMKIVMMVQSTISLATIVVIAGRAINILG